MITASSLASTTLNPSLFFPLELNFDEIGVVIDEQSDEYTVEDKATTTRNMFNVDTINSISHAANDSHVVHAMCSQPRNKNDDYNRRPRSSNIHERTPPDHKNTSITLNMGHCVTRGDLCYILAKATLCQICLSIPSNEDYIIKIT